MEIWHIWILAGIGFLIWEIFTPGFVVGNIGLGCFAGALISYLDGSLTYQVVAFAALNLIGFIFIRPLFLKSVYRAGDRKKLGAQAMVGRVGQVVEEIRPGDGKGRVKLGGEEWRAVSRDGETVEAGKRVKVVELESTVLTVTPVEE